MKRLAQGRLDTGVPPMGEGDEVAEMSKRIQVFKDNAIEKARLEAEAEAGRKAAKKSRARQEIETQKYIDATMSSSPRSPRPCSVFRTAI